MRKKKSFEEEGLEPKDAFMREDEGEREDEELNPDAVEALEDDGFSEAEMFGDEVENWN